MADLHALLDREEVALARLLGTVLGEVAAEFAAALDQATEIVAARLSVASITRMWSERIPRIVRRLLGTVETAADTTATGLDATLPDGWDDLPGRYDDDRPLPAQLGRYVARTEHLLRAVGDRLSAAATAELAAGLDAGEDTAQLQARLHRLFARGGTQLGPGRRARIARTEAARAWNTATLAAGQALTGPDRPLVKQWLTQHDSRVRDAHEAVDGQLRLIDEPFTVGGIPMMFPGDPSAPPDLVVNCRCVLKLATATRASAFAIQASPGDKPSNVSEETPVDPSVTAAADGSHRQGGMIALMPTAEDAARLALDGGEPVGELHLTLAFLGDDGAAWTPEQRAELIGLVQARAADLAPITARAFGVNHWNPASDSPSWVWAVGDDREAPAGSTALTDAHAAAIDALESTHDRPEVPVQHSPWSPHVCGVYDSEDWPLPLMEERCGPVTFDRIRLAFAGDYTDIPLGAVTAADTPPADAAPYEVGTRVTVIGTPHEDGQSTGVVSEVHPGPAYGITFDGTDMVHHWYVSDELAPADGTPPPPTTVTAAAIDTRTWSTPGDSALAYEDEQTGDGRLFTPGSLYWEDGPWPLQYADEMQMGHDGAELAGAIQEMTRDGSRLTGTGVLYAGLGAGADAVTLLEEGAPLGVSVDLDDVDVEFVDTTGGAAAEDMPTEAEPVNPEEYALAATARLTSASVLRLPDGAWMITARAAGSWTASGTSMSRAQHGVQLITGPGGRVSAASLRAAFAGTGVLTAAAGDPDDPNGVVVHAESCGDLLTRITRARVRGATLVSMPAYNRARIVLDPVAGLAAAHEGGDGMSLGRDNIRAWKTQYACADVVATVTETTLNAAASSEPSDLSATSITASAAAAAPSHSSPGHSATATRAGSPMRATSSSRSEDSSPFPAATSATRSSTTGAPTGAPSAPRSTVRSPLPSGNASGERRTVSTSATASTVGASSAGTASPGPTPSGSSKTRAESAPSATSGSGSTPVAASGSPTRRTSTTATPPGRSEGSSATAATWASGTSATTLLASSAQPGTSASTSADGPFDGVVASAVGDTGLPVDTDPSRTWDGGEAKKRILARATAEDGTVNPDKLAAAYLWRDDEADPATASAYRLPFADVVDGELRIIPAGVYAAAGVLQGSMGGVDLPAADRDPVKARVETLYGRIAKALKDPSIVAPWVKDDATASAATADADRERVVTFVRTCPVPVGAREAARRLGLSMRTAQRYLADAVKAGTLVRLARGLYVGPSVLPEGLAAAAAAEPEDDVLLASAWTAMRDADPLPAAWFAEPTEQELPPGSGGVHCAGGRIWGWVAQAGEPHAGYPGRNLTIESLGAIDLTHFLRARFPLDDGGTVRAGAMTMNVGHHRDGGECETESCQWDDTRTVAGIVTVGMNSRGMWFSGAAAPWLSDWDRAVFSACQPSYHMKQAPGGGWQLRAVLSVPVPGHSSPLLASVAERSNLALAASAAAVADTADTVSGLPWTIPADVSAAVSAADGDSGIDVLGHRPDRASGHAPDMMADVSGQLATLLASLLTNPAFLDQVADAVELRQATRAEIAHLAATLNQPITAGTAGAPKGA